MIEAIGSFLGRIAMYVTVLLGLIALYFLWVAFREWRASRRAMFGVERDIAASEMMGAIARAGGLVVIGLLVFGLGWLGRQSASDGETAQATRSPLQTTPGATAATPGPTLPPTDTPQPVVTDVPPLPEVTMPPPAVEPTPQTAIVNAFGGVWLRDAPNGGTIVVVPQNSVVELLEGRQAAGDFEWQKVRILNVPPGSQAQAGQEGWVASEYLEVGP